MKTTEPSGDPPPFPLSRCLSGDFPSFERSDDAPLRGDEESCSATLESVRQMKVDGDESRRIVVSESPYTHGGRKCLPKSCKMDSCPILDMRGRSVTPVLHFCPNLLRLRLQYARPACYGGCFLVSCMMRRGIPCTVLFVTCCSGSLVPCGAAWPAPQVFCSRSCIAFCAYGD